MRKRYSQQCLDILKRDPTEFVQQFVTMDETCVHHYTPATKQQSKNRWRSWFLEGRQNVHGDERSGSPVTATDNAAVAAVRNVVEADRRVTIDEIMIRLPPGIDIRRSSIGTIMSDVLNFLKVCTRWVQRMEAARAFLEMHQRDGDQLFSSIVTGDESWVHHSTPETKRQSMVWKKPEESAPKLCGQSYGYGKLQMGIFHTSTLFSGTCPKRLPSLSSTQVAPWRQALCE
ncbi:hypothetical protein LAZ67_20001298 [Cordylochernes scorpioides]|uniref:Transposase n=1 Tax=Cordylochernes scorpioides TaxID=51811 RepID=A0ABY6LK45_9ARAC|nr:hypothetical protein LAZ67_20001298 [Cordylochernes scorpioides]